MALEVGSLETKGNENDVNRSKTTNNKAREVIIEMKEYDQREGVGEQRESAISLSVLFEGSRTETVYNKACYILRQYAQCKLIT